MAFTSGDKSLTKDNILKQLDSYQLFTAYCKNFKEIDRMFKSEFRDEKEPSCHIIVWKGDLLYKDFGDKSYRVFDYIARKFNTNYTGALEIVTVIEIKPRSWTKLDLEYWSSYHIPLRLLEYHNIKSISHYKITNSKVDGAFYALNPYMIGYSFDYYWNEDVFRRKLYFPQLKTGRFVSNVDDTIVQGWTLLPKGGDILFITKSYKDILIFNLLGYWAIAPNNEGSYIPEEVMEKLKSRFKHIFVWFDNDEGGIKGGTQFSDKFDLIAHHNPVGEPKDPSDYAKKYGLSQFDKLVTDFLNNAYR
jgi:hypothetical protein